ncbi:alpha-(1,3)-fucosyltransferase 7-like [Diadema antillarum]|uniref:alpha-(1,3)-fucosyltransferase 7-like n=1 Tax=Diadema antillarum TaxID=105358 RepID=UPI003A8C39D8
MVVTKCVKRIHIFSDMELIKHVPELKHYTGLFKVSTEPEFESDVDCFSRGYDCDLKLTLGANISMIKGKDAVVFGMVGTQFRRNSLLDKLLELEPEPGQTWIYFSTESPLRIVRWTETLEFTRLKYHLLMTYDSRSDIHIPFGYYRPFNDSEDAPSDSDFQEESFYNRTGLISWVASNCKGVFWPRNSLISKLLQIMPLDDYGACGHKECLPKRSEYCNKLLARYRFYLATPNSECYDYITEKFWLNSLTSGVVPVVFGTRRENYMQVAPPNSFVHAADFETLQDLADYLNLVANDDELYRKYYEWRKTGEVVLTFPTLPGVFCRAIPYLHPVRHREVKYIGDSPWYTGCRELPDRHTIKVIHRDLADWSIWR